MIIVVCIKQVPDTNNVRINPETKTLIREGVESIINPFDCYALEEGVRLKERLGGKVIVLTMGPPQAESALREAISLGADEAVLLSDRAFAGSDTLATSYALAQAIRKLGHVDLIICGKQAIDGDTAQVGPGIAVHLGLPQITYVRKIEAIENGIIRAERLNEEGYDVLEVSLPAMLTVVKEINQPRIASLKGKMAAKKAVVLTWKAADVGVDPALVGLEGSPTLVVEIFTPPPRKGGKMITGEPADIAGEAIRDMRAMGIV
ncbi:MAG: electron transfer flavoprotein subunit beta/FixA family protein [bacterium]|nr:electron transfer flavoprotein subunit beta/FixA family protein [bacterium]